MMDLRTYLLLRKLGPPEQIDAAKLLSEPWRSWVIWRILRKNHFETDERNNLANQLKEPQRSKYLLKLAKNDIRRHNFRSAKLTIEVLGDQFKRPLYEMAIAEFVKCGKYGTAHETAAEIGRSLTSQEISKLISYHTKWCNLGGLQEIVAIAGRALEQVELERLLACYILEANLEKVKEIASMIGRTLKDTELKKMFKKSLRSRKKDQAREIAAMLIK